MTTDDRAGNNLGDGDLADPDVHDVSDAELTDRGGSGSPWTPGEADADDGDERASEIDDVTAPVARPDAASGSEMSDEEIVDVTDVDVPALLAEREEFRALAQRLQADFDNYRKRAQAQAQADVDRATGRLAEALLPVLDAAEAAYLRHPEEVGPLLNQMLVELKKHGLETLDLDGRPFDPEVAEAVAHEPGDGGEPTVAEVLRSGYRWKGRTLRAAMVKTTD